MRIEKYIDISQTVDIDLSIEDLVLIFDEEIDIENQRHILRQISSAFTFFKALPDKFINGLNNEQKKITYSAFSDIVERFKPSED